MRTMRVVWKVLLGILLSGLVLCVVKIDEKEYSVQFSSRRYKQVLEQQETETKALEELAKQDERPIEQNLAEKEGGEKRRRNQKADGTTDGQYDGYIDCLLEIPKIDMCRVVITGGDIEYNLANHYFAAARQDMTYGDAGYVIFGHQSFTKGKGMNRLDELVVGDVIYISGEDFKDAYEVTEIVESREGEAIADFCADQNHLALYTCKKQHERPKPYMIVRAVRKS